MEEIYKYTGWFFAIIVGGIGGIGGIGGVRLLINHFAQARVKFYFDKQLEEHKHSLAIITKNAEYDISKKLFDFEAYASKKHTVYPELYSLILESRSELSRFRFKFDMEIRESKKDLDETTLRPLFYKKMSEASAKRREAYNYFYKNELYLSKEVSIAYEEILDDQQTFELLMVSSFGKNIRSDRWRDASSRLIIVGDEHLMGINAKINILKEIIYRELSYTHYEKEEALS